MSSDLEDTLTANPPVAAKAAAELDYAETFVPGVAPEHTLDPHMWPVDEALAPPPAAVSAPAEPQFFGFRIGSSAIVLLDAIAYLGRKPSVPRVVRGGKARLVRVQSATEEVSSTHLELRQQGSTVVVQDLKSTNGTRLAVPGFAVRTLRPGESAVIPVGTLIDIGDRNVIEIRPRQDIV